MDSFFFIPTDPYSNSDFSSLVVILSFTYSKPCYLTMIYAIILFLFMTKYVTYPSLLPRPLYLYWSFYQVNDEGSSGISLISQHLSILLFLKICTFLIFKGLSH